MGGAQELTSADFDEAIKNGVTLVDFWAEWCGPCRMMVPILEELAEEYEGKVKVRKVNVDVEPDLAARYDVMAIPTLLVFKEGEVQKKFVGVTVKRDLVAAINTCT